MPINRTGAGSTSYRGYTQDHEYETDTGLLPLPVAGRTPKVRLIRLHGGMGTRIVKWTASRVGAPPIIPTPTSTAYDRIIEHSVTPSLPVPNPQGAGYDWTVKGEYRYIQVTPRTPGINTLSTGGYPFPLAPMDVLGNVTLNTVVSPGVAIPAGNPADTIMAMIANTVVNHESGAFIWPFTALDRKSVV